MEYFRSYKNIFALKLTTVIALVVIVSSCNPTKYIPDNESLLDKSEIKIDNNDIKKSDLSPYLKQTPNKRIFGTRFHLGLYNLSNIEKERWPHGWLRNIGEEPVLFDPFAASKSAEQLENFLFYKGYFNAEVGTDYFSRKKKTNIVYDVRTKEPYGLRNIDYNVLDTTIMSLVFMDTLNCLFEKGQVFDDDLITAERLRLERFIRDLGYYGFSRNDIEFKVDTTVGKKQIDIEYQVRKFRTYGLNNREIAIPHRRYRVNNIYIYTDFDPRGALAGADDYYSRLDTAEYNGYYFISAQEKPFIKYDVILQSLYIKPQDLFQVTNMERSQAHLNSLKAFRLVKIRYAEQGDESENERGELYLDCIIQLTPVSLQSFTVELEGTNSAGNLGGAINFIYQHKSLFHGAEQLSLKLKGAYESLSEEISGSKSTQEYGFEASLTLPKFLLPFLRKESFIRKYNPKTVLKAAYNYQKMPVYTRTVANATFGYHWRSGNFRQHTVNPLQFNVVKLPFVDPEFEQKIDTSSYLAYSYKDIFILGGNYTFVFNNQNIKKSKDYWFLKFNGELAGNLLALGYKAANQPDGEGSYQIFGQSFAQYVRGDVDIRYNYTLNNYSSVVYRAFIGVGFPYGNSRAIPFEKQFFGGGANGVRGWQVRSLGPGSYTPVDSSFFNQTADIKLEFNAEYRFKLFWRIEGALFVDAGNIWTFYEDEDRPGAQFMFDKFYKDLALGTGLGIRLDLNFVILRTDLGVKMRDPQLPDNPKWIMSRRSLNFKDDFTISFSIGYPF